MSVQNYGLMMDRAEVEQRIRELYAAGYKIRVPVEFVLATSVDGAKDRRSKIGHARRDRSEIEQWKRNHLNANPVYTCRKCRKI